MEMIQSGRYHRQLLYAQNHNLLPISFSQEESRSLRLLEFYSTGFLKEKLSNKIVNSFEICDPSFFTSFRDSIMNTRKYVYDQLFLSTFGTPVVDKSKFVGMFIAECFIQSKNHLRSSVEVSLLLELMNFVLNCLFLAGCDLFFQMPSLFQLKEPDRQFNCIQKHKLSVHNEILSTLFD